MKNSRAYRILALLVIMGMLLGGLGTNPAWAAPTSNDLRISQVYGGGGNSGATYKNDFIEIFNAGTSAVNLSGWSVQYASATGTTWQVTNLTPVSLNPGQYYLIWEAAGSGGTADLPTPDATGSITMSATAGKVALVNSTTVLSGSCPTSGNIIDFVGFGSTANCFEGSGSTPAPSNTTSVSRLNSGCQDTDDNAGDFAAGAPNPRNTSSPMHSCGGSDPAPIVSSHDPDVDETGVLQNADISITFSEAVTLSSGWYDIDCTLSGNDRPATVTGGPQTYTLNPTDDFELSDECTVTIDATKVEDLASQPMAANYDWDFTVTDGSTCATDLFISEYVEGSSYNKAIEIVNATASTITFDNGSFDYNLRIYSSADTAYTELDLTGSVAAGDVFVICHTSANATIQAQCDQPWGSLEFNGDDAVALNRAGVNLDVIGSIGIGDPGTEWNAGGDLTTADNTLQRKDSVWGGDGDGSDDFEVELPLEWNGFAVDTFSGLGAHVVNCVDPAPSVSSSTPADGGTGLPTTNIQVNFSEDVNVSGTWFAIACTTSGSHSAAQSGGPQSFTLNPDVDFTLGETCTVTIYAAQVTDQDSNDPPDTMVSDHSFDFTVGVPPGCGDNTETPIHTIQGSGMTSPMVGSTNITIEGVVVGDYQGPDGLLGFFVQDEAAEADGLSTTSDGIFVYQGTSNTTEVVIGDWVRATGTVVEYDPVTTSGSTLTELSVTSGSVLVCGSDQSSLVTAAEITLPVTNVDDLERYEGMRVTFLETLVVADNYYLGRYGFIGLIDHDHGLSGRTGRPYQFTHDNYPDEIDYPDFVSDLARHMILLDDGSRVQNPDPILYPGTGLTAANTLRAGDTVSGLTGVLDYCDDTDDPIVTWDVESYRLRPVEQVDFTPANPRPAAVEAVGGAVRVVAANVLNYFNGDGLGGGFPTSRGAGDLTEYQRQHDKIVAALLALDADVIALMEIESEDDLIAYTATSAIDDLVNGSTLADGMNAVAGVGTYAYLTPANYTANTDAIQVDIIYRTAVVTPDDPDSGATDYPRFYQSGTTFSRPPLVAHFTVNGTDESFWVVANHFKSKGCSSASGDNLDQDDGQGCYNARRVDQADALRTYINGTLLPLDPNVIVVGDLNAYRLEDPITTLTSSGFLTDLFGVDEYSYLFDGLSGYLDHALASADLLSRVTGVAHWHINGDEPMVLDYDMTYKSDAQDVSLYAPDAYRASDHDPLVVGLFPADYSDQVDSYGRALHVSPAGGRTVWLGSAVTNDTFYTEGADDTSDDGVVRLGTWSEFSGGSIQITVNGPSGPATGYVTCWIDWTRDGDFLDADEQVCTNLEVTGTETHPFAIPISADLGNGANRTYRALFRVYPSAQTILAAPSPTGIVSDGESESYVWGFTPTAISLSSFRVHSAPSAVLPLVALVGAAVLVGVAALQRRK